MASAPSSKLRQMCGPWRLLRLLIRALFIAQLAWILLALLWAFLPSPAAEHAGDNGSDYSTTVLKSGRTLTRVYDSNTFRLSENYRQGFAMDYKLNLDSHTLDIGSRALLPLTAAGDGNFTRRVEVVYARSGDTDGANMPWFTFADSVLLYSYLQEEHVIFPVLLQWSKDGNGVRKIEVRIALEKQNEQGESEEVDLGSYVEDEYTAFNQAGALLLGFEMQGWENPSIVVVVPETPLSSSPSRTYLVRLAIIHIIAPSALFIASIFNNSIGSVVESTILVLLAVFLYGAVALALVFSVWRVLRGPSFEETMERIQDRLVVLSENEELAWLKLDVVGERMEALVRHERFKMVLGICRNGWHPERDRALAADAERVDAEKALMDDVYINEPAEKGAASSR